MDTVMMDIDPPVAVPEAEQLPSELNTLAQGHGLEVSKDKLTVRYLAEGRSSNDVGAIQANRPAPSHCLVYYFEITVIDHGEHAYIAIGFTDKQFKLTRQPGWEANSYGYHGDDGHKYSHESHGKGEDYGPTFGSGDTVGAAVHWGRQEIFFTKNGTKLKTAFFRAHGTLIPTIGLHSKHEAVEVNFGQKPFKFDIEAMLNDERVAQLAAVRRVAVRPAVTHSVVRQYLLHYGYAETLRAFDGAAGASGSGHSGPAAAATERATVAAAAAVANGKATAASGDGRRDAGGAASSSNSGAADEAEASSLSVRNAVRLRVLCGDVNGALAMLQERCPLLLQPLAGWRDVLFGLHCQKYIELLRQEKVLEALAFAQEVLSTCTSPASRQTVTPMEAELKVVVALIAYSDPASSPLLGHLFGMARREGVADLVNHAMLCIAAGHGPSHRPVCVLQRLVKQVVALHTGILEQNGGQGERFQLAALLPPAVRSA